MSDLTDKPFGVNLPILFLQDESMINLVIKENIKFVTTSAGDPAKYIHVLKDAGITVFHAVPSLAGALKAVKAGVDGLVVEGTEGGGFKNPEEVIKAQTEGTFIKINGAGSKISSAGATYSTKYTMTFKFKDGKMRIDVLSASMYVPAPTGWTDMTSSITGEQLVKKNGKPMKAKNNFNAKTVSWANNNINVLINKLDVYESTGSNSDW